MKKTAGVRLMLVRDGASRMRAVRLSPRQIITLCIAGALTISGLIYGSSRLIAGYMTRAAMVSVLDQNRTLQKQLGQMAVRIDAVNRQYAELIKRDDELRLSADLPRIDNDTRQVGIGGMVNHPSDYGISDETVRGLVAQLDQLERSAKLQLASYAEIEKRMLSRIEIFAHTPSIRPVVGGYISSNFGMRRDPFSGRRVFHNGIDIPIERGTSVRATANGKVVFAQRTPGLGNLIVIDHGYGFKTAYGHLSSIYVIKGQSVTREQRIGSTGATGRSTAPHLHYEVHINGKPVNPLDFFYDDAEALAILGK